MNAQFDVTNIRIETDRLILRPWRLEDLVDLYEYASVPGVGEMAGWCHHKDQEESKEILQTFIDRKKTFALVFKVTGKVIGSLGIEIPRPDPVEDMRCGREIGYVLSKDYWGRGLMTEAVKAVCEYCFNVLGYDYLTCGHFVSNSRSARVIEKCGFRYFGESDFETHFGTTEISKNYVLFNTEKQKN